MVAGRIAGAGALTAIAALVALAPVAQGLTIGSTARPWGSTPGNCPIYATPGALTQGGGTAPSWRTPRGALTSWSMNVTGAPAGGQVRLTVIRGLTIVAIETGTIGDSLPPGGIAVYRPATPIAVAEGDRIAVGGDSVAACAFVGGVVPPDQ